MDRPLEGIRVLDLSHMLAAPLATAMLADLGADVVKIESFEGDHTRTVGARGAMFLSANRNKRSVVVDLRSPGGRDFVLRLMARSDVVVDAFRPGVMDKLGLGLEAARAANPGIIVASLVGFGATGPESGRRGVDLVLQAESGIMSITGEAGGDPLKVGFQLVDAASGMALAQAVLAALFRRERTGTPSEVEVRLFDTAVYLQGFQFTELSITGRLTPRTGNSAPHAAPSDLVRAGDGALVIAAYFEDQWQGLCGVLDLEWMLTDPRFATLPARLEHRREMLDVLESRFTTQPRAYWYERLNARGVLVGEVRTHDEIVASEQARVNGTFLETVLPDGTPVTLVRAPYVITPGTATLRPPPELGADTRAVARELGYSDPEIETLLDAKALGAPDEP